MGNPAKHIRKAIKLAGNSAPGPDGISFQTWRKMGHLGESIIMETVKALTRQDAQLLMDRAKADYGPWGGLQPGNNGFPA